MTTFDFSTFPTLTTERLLLREVDSADASNLLAFRGDPEVQRYNSRPIKNVTQALGLVDTIRQWYLGHRAVHWGVTVHGDQRVIGLFSLHGLDRVHQRGAIGYDLAREVWGRGYAFEGVQAVVRYAFEHLPLNRLEAITISDNVRSVHLLEKLGFHHEGTRREYSLEDDGHFHSCSIYGLLRREFFDAHPTAP